MERYHEVNIRELKHLSQGSIVNDNLSDDLFIAEMHYESKMDIIEYPCRFHGYMAFFCIKGEFEVEINLKKFTIRKDSMFIYTPGNIVRVTNIDPREKESVHFVVVAISEDLMSSTRFDFSKLYNESLRLLESPCVVINENERGLYRKYFDLIQEVSKMRMPNMRESVTALISSIFYLMGAMWTDRLTAAKKNGGDEMSTRSKIVLEDFLLLVRDYHTKERSLSFYADKLYLTPKYLSKLIKSVSGKSAHEWIDSFVILEAKNLLKYSDMSIKSIVYDLNFPNQTTFYRFFKTKTGMTPSEYRKM
ncbi:MAG: helix-turn-helix transcriptional regulator [Candidatus Cryptobacteroides sp.]|nr:helix-turn-helix transcriptional regulator [Bacteroidales bacterium]MDD7134423.1 helix-turn-helix transcriptional regulator [Bacteroidales bacterium]MDY2773948.1 helix-turn-helix transcriptional regulator [Candidatus Cryptobacteroides sp.]